METAYFLYLCKKETLMTQWEKMLGGEPYDGNDPMVLERLFANKDRVWRYNQIQPTRIEEREAALRQMLGRCGERPVINAPFYCDYGCNIEVGDRFFANFNFIVLDEARVTIGHDVFIGPNVSLLTACHPTDPQQRNTRVQWARPIRIGNNVWIGGSVTVLPGVTIGDGTTIGAGSVVVSDIPAHSIAVGNPCEVVKKL